MEWLASPEAWTALVTLTAMEIILGIDNIVFISVLVNRLPEAQRARARFIGLSIAMGMRILLLLLITWIMRLNADVLHIAGMGFSWRDLILIGGGLFLLVKGTLEIHHSLEAAEPGGPVVKRSSFVAVIVQIGLIDIVFSLDSVITAVGMADHVSVMVIAIVIAVFVMMWSAASVSDFIDKHPTIKMLALSFLVLIGTALIADGFDVHVPKGYIYFAMAFSVFVELLNLRLRRRRDPVSLRKRVTPADPG